MTDIVIGENDIMSFVGRNRFENHKTEDVALLKKVEDPRAEMAKDLIKSWGMVAAKRTQDTPSGHPASDMLSCKDVVERAFSMTELAYAEMEKRGWLITMDRRSERPDPSGIAAAKLLFP